MPKFDQPAYGSMTSYVKISTELSPKNTGYSYDIYQD